VNGFGAHRQSILRKLPLVATKKSRRFEHGYRGGTGDKHISQLGGFYADDVQNPMKVRFAAGVSNVGRSPFRDKGIVQFADALISGLSGKFAKIEG
jgi:hypothetical protein